MVEVHHGLHFVEVVGDFRDFGIEQVRLRRDDFEIRRVGRRRHHRARILDVFLEHLDALRIEHGLLGSRIVLHEGVRHLVSGLKNGVLPRVVGLFVLHFSHSQTRHDLSVLENGLHEASHSRQQQFSGVHEAVVVGEGARTRDGDLRIEARARLIHVVEALRQRELGSVDVGTVVEQLDAHARGKVLGQVLSVERAAMDGLGRQSEQQRERIFDFAHLPQHIDALRLHAVVGGFGTLHGGRAIADARVFHHLHLLPRFFRQRLHLAHDFDLFVEHQQGVIEVGDARNQVGLDDGLIVFRGEQLHLCRAFRVEQIAEQIDVPRGCQRHLIDFRRDSGVGLQSGNRALCRERQRRQEGQSCTFQRLLDHFHVQRRVEHIHIVVERGLDEVLQRRVGEHRTPRHIAEGCGVGDGERVGQRNGVAKESLRVHIGSLVFPVKAFTACHSDDDGSEKD